MWPSSEGPGCVKLRGGGGDGGSPRVGIPGTLAWGGQRPGMEGWSPRAAPSPWQPLCSPARRGLSSVGETAAEFIITPRKVASECPVVVLEKRLTKHGHLAWGREHTVKGTGDVLQNCALGACVILLTNATPINSTQIFIKRNTYKVQTAVWAFFPFIHPAVVEGRLCAGYQCRPQTDSRSKRKSPHAGNLRAGGRKHANGCVSAVPAGDIVRTE